MTHTELFAFTEAARDVGDDHMTALALHATGEEWDSSGLDQGAVDDALKMTPREAMQYVEAFAMTLAGDLEATDDTTAMLIGLAEAGAHEVM